MESVKTSDKNIKNHSLPVAHSKHVNSNVRKATSHSAAVIYSPVCHMDAASIVAFLLAS